jgi:hypothetical protein
MNLLSKETLIGAVALGAGAVAAKVVQKKVLPMAKLNNPNIQNLVTLGVGIFVPSVIKSNIGKSFGAGMIAVSVAGLIDPVLSKAGITGVDDDTFLGDVLMGDTFMGDDGSDGTLMGATGEAYNDFTSGNAGEMDY